MDCEARFGKALNACSPFVLLCVVLVRGNLIGPRTGSGAEAGTWTGLAGAVREGDAPWAPVVAARIPSQAALL